MNNPHAVALGRLGGSKGGYTRATKLTPQRRSEIARKAALARWGKPESIKSICWKMFRQSTRLLGKVENHRLHLKSMIDIVARKTAKNMER